MSKIKITLSVFIITALVHLISIQFGLTNLQIISKPLIMVLLMNYFLVSTNKSEHPTFFVIAVAIVFSWLGDVFLMFQSKYPSFFIIGLGAFLVSHIFYIVAYKRSRGAEIESQLSKPRLARYDFFLLLICSSLIIVLYPHLGDMMIPVIIYALTITYMAITSVHRFGKTSVSSFWMVTVGALLFMFSDATIALDKFVEPIPNARLIIMTTYISAQFLIIKGLINHVK